MQGLAKLTVYLILLLMTFPTSLQICLRKSTLPLPSMNYESGIWLCKLLPEMRSDARATNITELDKLPVVWKPPWVT